MYSNQTILITGFVNTEVPIHAIQRVADSGSENLTLICTTGIIDIDRIPANMISKTIYGHYGLLPRQCKAVEAKAIHAVNMPQGVLTMLVGGVNPYVSKVGKSTFIEHNKGVVSGTPDQGDVVVKEDHLEYHLPSVDVALVKAAEYDLQGNIDFGDGMPLDKLNACRLAHTVLIDCPRQVLKVKSPDYKLNHLQRLEVATGGLTVDIKTHKEVNVSPEKEAYCKRVAEYVNEGVCNVGIGLPELVSKYIKKNVMYTVEAGTLGGTPNSGSLFGTAIDPLITFQHDVMFAAYHEGLIDTSILGVGEFDLAGKVNVHNFNGRLTGCGGFIDITCSAKRILFCASESKLKESISEITFNPNQIKPEQEVFVFTEKRVFELKETGLVEISS